jgi:cytochrome c biogenesis protein CcmG/thiol:disulfide interchange protein DsbE
MSATLLRRLVYVLPALTFTVLIVYLAQLLKPDREPRVLPSALIEKPAPDFALPPLLDGGEGLSTADLRGRVTLVNFFASWCVPCQAEHPLLMRLAREEGLTLYGIAYKDEPAAARRFIADLGDPFARISMDSDGRTAIDFGVYGIPETYLIDREGRIRYRYVGPLTPAVIEKELLPIAAELAP